MHNNHKKPFKRLLSLRNLVPVLTIAGALASTFIDKPLGLDRDQLTPGLLALLAIDALIERLDLLTNIEEDVKTLKRLTVPRTVMIEEFPPELHSDLERARQVWLTGIHPYSKIAKYYSLLEKKIRHGDKVRVLVVDPNGTAYKMSAMRFSGRATEQEEHRRTISTLAYLCELKKMEPDNLEVRTIDYLLGYGVFLLDPDTEHGAAYVRRYTFKTQISAGAITPKSVYRPEDGSLYELISAETRELWNCGTPWEC